MNWIPTDINPDGSVFNGGMNNLNISFQSAGNYFVNPHITNQQYFDWRNSQRIEALIEARKKDQEYLNEFVSKLKPPDNENKTNFITISEAKKLLFDIIAKKKQLESLADDLDASDENFDSKWSDISVQMKEIDNRIISFDKDVKAPLKIVIHKRLKKRQADKKRKMKYKALKEKTKKDIEEKHKTIDKLLSERSEEVEAVKREAALKRQADTVLHEVRRKKYEAKKMLNMLSALAKLRELRSKQEKERGGYCSEQLTETFNGVMDRFQKLWERQIEVYKLEERGLKMMLEENSMPHVKESKLEMNILEWEKALFGDVTNDENEKRLTMADSDINTLIQVRNDWDQFIKKEFTPMSSGIPLGWVLPTETDNEEWKAFTKLGKKMSL